MYRIAIVEDEKSFADQLMEYLREYEKEHALSFEITVFAPGKPQISFKDLRWVAVYLTQLLLSLTLYLENELFKKSELRQEIHTMELLHQNAKEQYELTRENIALINQKCHDLKHQIRALRNATKEELEHYLEEIEGQVQIYDAIVKTGNSSSWRSM